MKHCETYMYTVYLSKLMSIQSTCLLNLGQTNNNNNNNLYL